ncbi:MAG: glycosyltransferase family 2 protein [Elusimicrobia bacterium]|nr:glycosyltransferase family 2 protein [Elusimicrobiota bacterium]
MIPITLVMIARNEEKDLPTCLESALELVSEIILVDNYSTDKTAEIAKSFGAKVFTRAFDNYTNQKNYALSLAQNDWVLHLDPDEKLSPQLKVEISALMSGNPSADGYYIPYENYFLGRKMRHSGLAGERHVRLFRKSKSSFAGGVLHEGIEVRGQIYALKNKIIHNSYPDMEEYLEKFNRYTTLAAQKMRDEGKKFSVIKMFSTPLYFHKRYFLQLGFLDGVAGLVWSAVSAFYVFVKYAKLWKLERND